MPDVFVISDTHFGHENICKFTDLNGNKLRPFENATEMDEVMIEKWNSRVRPNDKVYHLGDVTLNRKLAIMLRLNGTKVLIKGNHDQAKLSEYAKYFKDVRSVHLLDKYFMLSHVPIHETSLIEGYVNMHGHTHERCLASAKYLNVCVECTGYEPIELNAARAWSMLRLGREADEKKRRGYLDTFKRNADETV